MKKNLRILLILMVLLAAAGSVCAETEPRPSDSVSNALFFGDIDGPLPVDLTPSPNWETGMQHTFSVLDIAAGKLSSCSARIMLITENIVFWCDERAWTGIPENTDGFLRRFDSEILPLLRETFGHEPSPGVDNDPRFHVLFTDLIGQGYNGYFSAADSADTRLNPTSNGMELVFLSTNLLSQGGDAILDTLSHEVQHMIHFAQDPNEPSFINEGLSGLAQNLTVQPFKNHFIRQYLNDTSRSLIWWPESGSSGPWYGSSFLFCRYLFDRFGSEFIHTLTAQPGNGMNGIDQALQQEGIPLSADEVFSQWAAALLGELIQNPVREWGYSSYVFPQDGIYRDVRKLSCGVSELHELPQYGLLFYRADCGQPFSLKISGEAENTITTLSVSGGDYSWWSGAVNNSLSFLRREFDLSEVTGPAWFEYDINFNIENGYDYYYLLLRDGNGRITRLAASTATDSDPTGQNLGGGTTGSSGGVLHESINLSPWTGQQIELTFVYLTDTAGISDGLLLDNFRIEAIGFFDNTETSDNGWEAEGFSRIPRTIPQNFILVLLHPQNDGTSTADFYPFSGGNEITIDCPEGNCVAAISAVDREIRSRTSFTITALPLTGLP